MSDLLWKLTDEQAREVLERLYEHSDAIKNLIDSKAKEILQAVNVDEIAEDVFAALDSLDTETLFDRSGPHSSGYTSPDEEAYDMFDEELEPFETQIKNYHELNMFPDEKLYCMGVLKGIYRYDQEAISEFKEWASDAAQEFFYTILNDWRSRCNEPALVNEMMEFIRISCPAWSKDDPDEESE
jgi:hypothetical protein